jgi:hypothetical protein
MNSERHLGTRGSFPIAGRRRTGTAVSFHIVIKLWKWTGCSTVISIHLWQSQFTYGTCLPELLGLRVNSSVTVGLRRLVKLSDC